LQRSQPARPRLRIVARPQRHPDTVGKPRPVRCGLTELSRDERDP